jgi:formate hydrogenlyase subunit 3/multisubunit Na+/H+ antiporter MnhD subunit
VTPPEPATGGGWLLALAVAAPAACVPLALVLGERGARRLTLALVPVGLAIAAAVTVALARRGDALGYLLGGWPPPIGVALRADGLSAAMLLTSAVVIGAAALYARSDLGRARDAGESRASFLFWPLLLTTWAGLNAVFVGSDLFHLFVALELLTFGAVPLVCLDGRPATLAAALRYLLFALAGSVLYLLGVGLLYGAYGTLDVALLAERVRAEPSARIAAALMTAGLLAKMALFPLHLWLPPAHAGAPPAASAVLSALVVKGSFVLIVRLWLDALPGLATPAAAQALAALGAAAIVFGSVLALRQARLKLLVAYSTVAQVGYLFLAFPLASATQLGSAAWTGGILQAVSHAVAKAAMFLAAGLVAKALGHDRIEGLAGIGRALPKTLFAFGLAGLSLMGVPPSGGFVAKWLLLRAAIDGGQWWWALVILAGGLFTGGYVFRVVARALASSGAPPALHAAVPRHQEALVLGLALLSVAIGLLPFASFGLLQIGRPS